MSHTITVILNIYKRYQHLKEQFDAIMNQTIEPTNIFIWNNGCHDADFAFYKTHPKVTFFDSTENFGVWSRFFIGLNTSDDYVALFDDDTIPGNRWFENCIDTLDQVNGLLGTIGLRYASKNSYDPNVRYGWANPCGLMEVDIVGHAWFTKRKNFDYFINEIPNLVQFKTCGEDMHFSYTIQKYGNLKTYVPPHLLEDRSFWGADYDKSWQYGTEKVAISSKVEGINNFFKAYLYYINKGFEIVLK